ncbi:type I-E CRISPR-associated protein Cas6/Cse3/CasE [Brevibacterium sp. BRM-1]|uniref:type I-E CRISPR-associated protein Cas6/Cse3/CasE n=1 Tax=Brevibacterium sp. BRM-1 TaxID=2999062 RepID=UPI00227F79DE|nr:type I-E CRISPR-associated protein Cas6/Cse3/CasE [Brevibacterium sp. BRM-1]WAL39141.1 type I-E CRISPR-associated protein Cas6/Cse3/CasE [Brevibacterium sp. BRM-1]
MITLTRILVNPQKRQARELLSNPQALHAAVRSAFPPDIDSTAARILWRLDQRPQSHEVTLYIVGPEEPDAEHLGEQLGWPSRPPEIADYTPFLDRLRVGQEWGFALRGNPVRALATERGTRGRVVPHVTVSQQTAWFTARAEAAGFTVDSDNGPRVRVTERNDLSFRKDGGRRRIHLRTARFEGALQVTDTQALRHALTHGIGRAKAYGCGMLTLARPE